MEVKARVCLNPLSIGSLSLTWLSGEGERVEFLSQSPLNRVTVLRGYQEKEKGLSFCLNPLSIGSLSLTKIGKVERC